MTATASNKTSHKDNQDIVRLIVHLIPFFVGMLCLLAAFKNTAALLQTMTAPTINKMSHEDAQDFASQIAAIKNEIATLSQTMSASTINKMSHEDAQELARQIVPFDRLAIKITREDFIELVLEFGGRMKAIPEEYRLDARGVSIKTGLYSQPSGEIKKRCEALGKEILTEMLKMTHKDVLMWNVCVAERWRDDNNPNPGITKPYGKRYHTVHNNGIPTKAYTKVRAGLVESLICRHARDALNGFKNLIEPRNLFALVREAPKEREELLDLKPEDIEKMIGLVHNADMPIEYLEEHAIRMLPILRWCV